MKVCLNRAMCFGGARHEAGATLDVADPLARELIAQRRAAPADGAAVKPVSGPMTTETSGALTGEPEKGKKHARS